MLRGNGGLGIELLVSTECLAQKMDRTRRQYQIQRDTDEGGLDRQGLLLTQAGEWEVLRHMLVPQTLKPTRFSTSF